MAITLIFRSIILLKSSRKMDSMAENEVSARTNISRDGDDIGTSGTITGSREPEEGEMFEGKDRAITGSTCEAAKPLPDRTRKRF
jgi:hypothetical protein